MRKLIMAIVAGLMVSSISLAQTSKSYQEVSKALVEQADAALSTGAYDDAKELYERALVANPKNGTAYVGLGQVYEGLDRVGRGLRFYRKALEIEPNDTGALRLQALAFLRRGLINRANKNRDRLARICGDGCRALDDVEIAIETWHAVQDAGDREAEGNS